jgi:hypothetical protein
MISGADATRDRAHPRGKNENAAFVQFIGSANLPEYRPLQGKCLDGYCAGLLESVAQVRFVAVDVDQCLNTARCQSRMITVNVARKNSMRLQARDMLPSSLPDLAGQPCV